MWHPKLRIVERKDPHHEGRGLFTIYWWDRETKKYRHVTARFGYRTSKEKAYEKMKIKREELVRFLTYDGDEKVYK